MKITIDVHDLTKPQRERLLRVMGTPAAVGRAMAEAALPVIQRQLVKNGRTNRNAFGARSTFWTRMNAGTRAGNTPTGGVVMMPREMRLRVFGGTVRPVHAKNLTIPLRAEAYGKSLRQFERVFFFRRGGRLFAATRSLAIKQSRRGSGGARNKDGSRALKESPDAQRITVLFLLAKSATIRGNRTLLPDDAVVTETSRRAVNRLLRG